MKEATRRGGGGESRGRGSGVEVYLVSMVPL